MSLYGMVKSTIFNIDIKRELKLLLINAVNSIVRAGNFPLGLELVVGNQNLDKCQSVLLAPYPCHVTSALPIRTNTPQRQVTTCHIRRSS